MSILSSNRLKAAMALSLLWSAVAIAAPDEEKVSEALLACAAVTDDVRRLECFDEKMTDTGPASIAEDVVENPPVELEQEASPISVDKAAAAAVGLEQAASPPNVDNAPAASEQAASPTVEAAVPSATSSVDEFGMTEKLASQSPDEDRPVEVTEITAKVTEVTKRPGGEHIVTLDNGQVWTEKRVEHGFRVKVGDTMTIKKGKMGGYRMIRGYHSSAAVRVE